MASDVGIVKIGISSNPKWRLSSLKSTDPRMNRLAGAYGVPRDKAIEIEKLAHKRFSLVSIGREMFRLSEKTAVAMIESILAEQGISARPFKHTPWPKKQRDPDLIIQSVTLRMTLEELNAAKQCAHQDCRTFTGWIIHLMAREVRDSANRSREPVTAGSR
jgi:hypothetical protein